MKAPPPTLLLTLGSLLTLGLTTPYAAISAVNLRCEALHNPLAIDTPSPNLGWTVHGPAQGQRQTAYRILVARHPNNLNRAIGDCWDSGRVQSDQSRHIPYRGPTLNSGDRVWWKVKLWDKDGHPGPWSPPALWQTALLAPSDWRASWIGAPYSVPQAVGPHNGFHSRLVNSPDTNQWIVLDLGPSQTIDAVRLWPARPFDWQPDSPGFLFPVRYRLEGATDDTFSHPILLADRTGEDQPNPGTNPVTLLFAPVKLAQIRLTVTRLAQRQPDKPEFGFALAEMEALAHETNAAPHARASSPHSLESGGWSHLLLTDGLRLPRPAHRGPLQPATRLRREFTVPPNLARATLHVTAQGLYEARLNGQRVDHHVLAPEWTDYHQRIQYQTYDVTALLRPGLNAAGVTLAEGWFAGRIGLTSIVPGGPMVHLYGTRPSLLFQLELTDTSGHRSWIVSDGSWSASLDGPIRHADLLDGEIIDARLDQPGWDRPNFQPALPLLPLTNDLPHGWLPAEVRPPTHATLVPQLNEPIRVTQELHPVRLTEPSPGVFVFDLGQNMVGWCRLRLRGYPGQTITLRHAEMLQPDGHLYRDNLRGVPQEDRFTLRGHGLEIFEPQFTYHGFRYVEVRGLLRPPSRRLLTGCVVHSDAPDAGDFSCSDPRLNRLWRAIEWTLRGNLHSTPTDCPQRDERLGWMGDAQVFAQTAAFSRHLESFFRKWLVDVRDAQADDGRFPDFAPHPFDPNQRFSGAPAWSDAGVFVPWRAYVNYGDRRLLEHHYQAAKHWVDFVRCSNPDLIWRHQRGNDYNDWLNGDTLKLEGWPKEGGAIPPPVFATAFFAQSTTLVARMAAVLGHTDDAAEYSALATQIRDAFNLAFVRPDGLIEGDTQAGYALALHFDLLPPSLRAPAAQRLVATLERYAGRPSTGIQSTIRMLLELANAGHANLVYALLARADVPSWGYMLEQGATTIWERWDGFVQGRGFQDPGMNSFNHYAFGAVGEWLWREIVGLHPDENHPGWKHFLVRPRPGGQLSWARGQFRSPSGPIDSAWRIRGRTFHLNLTIPPNTTATIHLPPQAQGPLQINGRPLHRAPHVTPSPSSPQILRLASGTYHLRTPWNPNQP